MAVNRTEERLLCEDGGIGNGLTERLDGLDSLTPATPMTPVIPMTPATMTPATPTTSAPVGHAVSRRRTISAGVSNDGNTNKEILLKKKKTTSAVWVHFERVEEDGALYAICNYCKSKLCATQGTSSLHRHAKRCATETDGPEYLGGSKPGWVFSQEVTELKMTEMVILHEYCFSIGEHKGFLDMMDSAQPSFKVPGRRTLRNNCVQLYQEMKKIEITKMAEASQICLTTDMWTAIDLTGYMVVTAHYILNEWELVKRIIGFKPLPPPHNGPAIAERLGHTLHEWKAISKVGFITLDNASANNWQ
ncbi:hypothetical protein PSHT_03748 [Puccinia striiformis]|uniref:BED-type domain-containing protein n=1 Tax=Puccinia striiformis TaxID=27350 RepID=A0A2S4WEJ4_9BASI|nr:hypothetical protein PSHT_03748 [Puccinia striiformis]